MAAEELEESKNGSGYRRGIRLNNGSRARRGMIVWWKADFSVASVSFSMPGTDVSTSSALQTHHPAELCRHKFI